jgi:hypothetical protein
MTLQPIFLPFIHQLMKYAAGYAPARNWLTVGQPFDARGILPPGDEYGIVLTPGSEQVRLANGTPLELEEVGFYELRDSRGSTQLVSFAANVDPAESEATVFDPAEMQTTLLAATQGGTAGGSGLGLTMAERERQQNGWWYLIVVAFVLLAIETLFSNRTSRGSIGGWWRRRERAENQAGLSV